MILRTLFLSATIAAFATVYAQEHCTAHTITQRHLSAQGLSTDIGKALSKLPKGQAKGGGQLTIPVVVHVVWNTAAENVPDATILDMIATMNEDHQGLNPDHGNVRAAFTGVQDDANINFCLAQFDPNGLPTTGITRTQTTDTWFDPDTETNDMKSPPTGKSPWDPELYLNIWICDIASGMGGGLITTGYAYLPVGGMVGSSIDGIVVDYNYGLAAGSRTASHEAGHYLGLQHPWGSNGGCVDDDGFSDTPDTDGPTFSCVPTSQTSCGFLTQYENFMDYSDCSCMWTAQQSAEMTSILTGVRGLLLTSGGCATTPVGPCVPTSTSGTGDGDFINGVVLGSIVNTNSGSQGGPSYTDHTGSLSTVLARGTTQTITIASGNYQPDHYAAWIDLDQDDVFEPTEKLGEFVTTATFQTQSLTFSIPANATLGTTVLRVRGVYHNTGEPSPTDPCYNYAWGETEDYGIVIANTTSGACTPTSLNGTDDGDFIDGVVLEDITNINTGSTGGPTYNDYSFLSTDLFRSVQYTLTITTGDYTPDHYAAWIDHDQDDLFEASEKLGEFTNTLAGQTQTISFSLPQSALLGNTRMRVRGVYHNTGEPSPTDPCFAYAFGETEDYSVNISTSTGLQDTSGNDRLSARPTNGGFVVTLPSSAPGQLSVYDAAGKLLASIPTARTQVILDAGNWPAGILQLVWLSDGMRAVGRFATTE